MTPERYISLCWGVGPGGILIVLHHYMQWPLKDPYHYHLGCGGILLVPHHCTWALKDTYHYHLGWGGFGGLLLVHHYYITRMMILPGPGKRWRLTVLLLTLHYMTIAITADNRTHAQPLVTIFRSFTSPRERAKWKCLAKMLAPWFTRDIKVTPLKIHEDPRGCLWKNVFIDFIDGSWWIHIACKF